MFNDFTDFKNFLLKRNISKGSTRFYLSDIRIFIRWVQKTTNDINVSFELIESYENFLKNQGFPNQTINRKLSSLRKFSEYLIENKVLSDKQTLKLKNAPKKSNVKYISAQFIRKYLRNIPQNFSLFLLFLLVVVIGVFVLIKTKQNSTVFVIDSRNLKLNFPNGVNLENNDYQKNFDRAINNDTFIQVDDDPSLNSLNRKYVTGRSEISDNLLEKRIFVPNMTSASYIFLTPFTPVNLYIKEQGDGYFVVGKREKSNEAIKFNWLVFFWELPIDTSKE